MVARKVRGIPAPLEKTRRRFERWRRTRKIGSRIPEPLWAAAVKLAEAYGIHPTAKALGVEIEEIREKKIAAVKSQNFEMAANFRDTEKKLLDTLDDEKEKWENDLVKFRETVDAENVAEVVAMMTGVPVQRISSPSFPPSGPRSIIWSATFITSMLCSMTSTVLPWSTRS